MRAISLLLRKDPVVFWDDLAGLAASLVEDELNAVRIRVQAALSRSRSTRRSLSIDAFDALNAASLSDLDEEGPEVVAVACPGCDASGWGTGYVVDEGFGELELSDGVVTWSWVPNLYLVLDTFRCQTCGLELTGQEEISEAGLPLKVDNDRASPSDAVEYPDLYDIED